MKKYFSFTGQILGTIMILGSLLAACGSPNRNMADDPKYREMVKEVSDLEFEIENEWANPTQYNRVNLLGNPNRIKFENDSVEVYLPFFGERYAGGAYDPDDGAIQYRGVPKNLKLQENPEKGAVNIFFEGNRNTESLDFRITIFPNGVARTSVTSTQRETIVYDGRLINR
ncbi:DUF4251 domain-containing protein [Salinimicrobium sp. CAU 1759]